MEHLGGLHGWFDGVARRELHVPESTRQMYGDMPEGQHFLWGAFVSATKKETQPGWTNLIFEIDCSQNGSEAAGQIYALSVERWSAYPAEQEIMFYPYTEYCKLGSFIDESDAMVIQLRPVQRFPHGLTVASAGTCLNSRTQAADIGRPGSSLSDVMPLHSPISPSSDVPRRRCLSMEDLRNSRPSTPRSRRARLLDELDESQDGTTTRPINSALTDGNVCTTLSLLASSPSSSSALSDAQTALHSPLSPQFSTASPPVFMGLLPAGRALRKAAEKGLKIETGTTHLSKGENTDSVYLSGAVPQTRVVETLGSAHAVSLEEELQRTKEENRMLRDMLMSQTQQIRSLEREVAQLTPTAVEQKVAQLTPSAELELTASPRFSVLL